MIGFIKIIEKIWASVLGPSLKSIKGKKDTRSEADTAVVKNDGKDYINKCNDWNMKNEYFNSSADGVN